jgi:hypothetical protein
MGAAMVIQHLILFNFILFFAWVNVNGKRTVCQVRYLVPVPQVSQTGLVMCDTVPQVM